MSPDDLIKYCRALDIDWPATMVQLDEAKRLQSQVWHPDRHQQNEKMRLRGEEKLKRVNEAYNRLREYLLAGASPACSSCGKAVSKEGTLCDDCQRKADLEKRKRENRQRDQDRREREAAEAALRARERKIQEREQVLREREQKEAAKRRYVDIAGRWVGGGCWMQFVGTGPEYQYYGGGLLGQTESGSATVAGTTVVLQGQNILFGQFSARLTVDGARLYGVVQSALGSAQGEFWKG